MKALYRIILTALILSLSIHTLTPLQAMAGEDGLYPAAPPAGSAFIRFINGDLAAKTVTQIHGKIMRPALLGDIGNYFPVPQGFIDLAIGTAKTSATLKTDRHYSAVLSKGVLHVLEEPSYDTKMKSQILLINLGDAQNITLKTPNNGVTVIDSTTSGTLNARAVNAVKIGFSVFSDGKKIADLPPRPLERGASYVVIIYKGTDGKPAITYEKATISS
jgi:hypothetical protein